MADDELPGALLYPRSVVLAVRVHPWLLRGPMRSMQNRIWAVLCDGTAVTRECLLPGEGHVLSRDNRMLDYELEHEMDYSRDAGTFRVHRGQEILIDTVEQIRDVGRAAAQRAHRGVPRQRGEDGGGLRRLAMCPCYTSLLRGAACPARSSIGLVVRGGLAVRKPVLVAACVTDVVHLVLVVQELANVIRDPDCALFQQVPEDWGLYQPERKGTCAVGMDVISMFRALGPWLPKPLVQEPLLLVSHSTLLLASHQLHCC